MWDAWVQNFGAPSFDDKKLEVVAVFGSMQMAVSRVINLQHHRIAQVPAVHLHVHPGMCSARTCTDIRMDTQCLVEDTCLTGCLCS